MAHVIRTTLLAVTLLGCTAMVLKAVHPHYPIQQWLIWRYLIVWGAALLFAGSCVLGGHTILTRVVKVPLALDERLALAFPTGVLAFGTGIFLAGLFRLLYWPFFFLLPVLMVAPGWRDNVRFIRRTARHLTAAGRVWVIPAWWRWAVGLLGLLGVMMMWLPTLAPAYASYDSQWYHWTIAEKYAATHRLVRFDEGWFPGIGPHLASLVYTWAMLLPTKVYFLRAELCLQLDFLTFVGMLAALPALTSRLLPRERTAAGRLLPRWRAPLVWTIIFLFPTIYLYDCVGAADHFAALFAPPAYLALLRAWPALDARWSCVMSAMAAGIMLVKYSAMPSFAFPVVAYVARVVYLLVRSAETRARLSWRGPLMALLTGLALTSTWWLKNWVWYHNPVYPNLSSVFRPTPWYPDAKFIFETWIDTDTLHPPRTLAGQRETVEQLWKFPFETHDWDWFSGKAPLFGFLFTMLSLTLPFAGSPPAVWGIFLSGYFAVYGWYSIHHQERYLEVPLPWMVAAVGAQVRLLAARGWVVRGPLALLIAAQFFWGLDRYLLPSHQPWIHSLLELVNTGYSGNYALRDKDFAPFLDMDKMLPAGAKVLLHEHHVHAGLQRNAVSDWIEWQGGINYGYLTGASGVAARMARLGITHVIRRKESRASDSIASDFLFYDWVSQATKPMKDFGELSLHSVSDVALPPDPPDPLVAVATCRDGLAPGLYLLSALRRSPLLRTAWAPPLAPLPATPAAWPATVRYAMVRPDCGTPPTDGFVPIVQRGNVQLLRRR